jgi:two-component system, cell cycle response regulator CpdR
MTHGDVVLAVDDNADVLNLVRAILLHNGFRVQVACDGAEGLERFHRHRRELGLVITDMMMPKMKGLDFARDPGR